MKMVCKALSFTVYVEKHSVSLFTKSPIMWPKSHFEENPNCLPFDPTGKWDAFIASNPIQLEGLVCYSGQEHGTWCISDESVYTDIESMLQAIFFVVNDLIDSFVYMILDQESIDLFTNYRFYIAIPITSIYLESEFRTRPIYDCSALVSSETAHFDNDVTFDDAYLVIRADFFPVELYLTGKSANKKVMIQFNQGDEDVLAVDKAMNYMCLHIYNPDVII